MNNPIEITIIAPCSPTEHSSWYGDDDTPPTTFIEHIVIGPSVPRNGDQISIKVLTGNNQRGVIAGEVNGVAHAFSNVFNYECVVCLKRESVIVTVTDEWKGPDHE